MKKAISNYRYYVLIALGVVCFFGIFAVPDDSLPFFSWLWILVSTKIIGLCTGYLLHHLIEHWQDREAIPELTEFINNF